MLAVFAVLAACGPPQPPPPPLPGSDVFVGTQRLDGLGCNSQGCLVVCTATLHMQIRLNPSAATLSSMVDYGIQPNCSPAGWTLQAWVVCEPDCGLQDAPTLSGNDSNGQRDWLYTLTAGSSVKPLPDSTTTLRLPRGPSHPRGAQTPG